MMSQKRKSPVAPGLNQNAYASSFDTAKCNPTKLPKEGKLSMMLRIFAMGTKLHRFQAEVLGDHCLHSSISDLKRRNGVHFARALVGVPNRFGTTSFVMRYWLEGENLHNARKAAGLEKVAL